MKNTSPSVNRVVRLSCSIVTGALLGVLCAVGWGENFRTRSVVVNGLGTLYRIALPTDMRELSDLRTAEIAAPSASDYERVGVNNYWIASSENPNGVMLPLPVVERRHGGALRGALNAFMPGRNFVVYEMENSSDGYCSGAFDVRLNGSSIVGVPLHAPSGPAEVLSLLRIADYEGVRNGFDKVLCSRRIIEINLGTRSEPLKRIGEFLAFPDLFQ